MEFLLKLFGVFNLVLTKITLILYRSKGWIVEDIDKYTTQKEGNNEQF